MLTACSIPRGTDLPAGKRDGWKVLVTGLHPPGIRGAVLVDDHAGTVLAVYHQPLCLRIDMPAARRVSSDERSDRRSEFLLTPATSGGQPSRFRLPPCSSSR